MHALTTLSLLFITFVGRHSQYSEYNNFLSYAPEFARTCVQQGVHCERGVQPKRAVQTTRCAQTPTAYQGSAPWALTSLRAPEPPDLLPLRLASKFKKNS